MVAIRKQSAIKNAKSRLYALEISASFNQSQHIQNKVNEKFHLVIEVKKKQAENLGC